MPTFSYKGYDFDVDHTPTAAEFSQMSAYVDTLPPKQTAKSMVDQIPGIGPEISSSAQPEPSLIDKLKGAGEAALNVGTGLTTGTLAGTVGGLQGILGTIADGTFGTKQGTEQAGDKFHEQAQMATYEPRSATGKQYAQKAGEFIQNNLLPLVGAAPQLEALTTLGKPAVKQMLGQKAPKPNAAIEAVLREDAAKAQPKEMPKVQEELDLGQPNQYGHRPSEFTLDENGIPIRRNASLEAQETARGGDLFSLENQANELRNDVINRAEPTTEGVPGSRDYLRKQEEELAYQQKAKQDSLIPEESVAEPSQRSVEMANPNRGKFGQGGAVNTGFSEAVVDATRAVIEKVGEGLSGIRITPALSKWISSGEFSQYFDDFKKDSGLRWYEHPQFMIEDGKLTFHTQDAHTVEKFLNYMADTPMGERGQIPPKVRSGPNPLGQTGFGKGQKGSIGFFGKDPFEKFAEQARKDYPQITEDQLQRAWEKQKATADSAITSQKESVAQGQAFNKITGLDPKVTGEVWTPEKAIEIFKTTPDIQQRSLVKEQIVSSGRIQRDLLNNPVTTWTYNLTNKAIEQGRLMARQVLDDVSTGIIPKIRSHTLLGGAKEMRELLKWRFENEGKGNTLPNTFSAKAKAINEALNKADEKLLSKMNEKLVAEGKKPIVGLDNHMVHYWSGPYRAYVYVKTSEGGSRLGFFVSEKSMKDAQKAMKWIRENIPNIDLEKTKEPTFVKSDIRNRSSMFDHLLDLSNEKDPTVLEALQAFKDRLEGAQSRHLGEHNRQKYRAGVQGFTGAKPWFDEARNYADSVDSIRTKYDAGYQWVAAQEIKQQMSPILEAQKNGEIAVGQALQLGQKYVDHALGKNVDMSTFTKFADYLEDIYPTKFGPARNAMNELQHVASRVTLPYLLALKGTQAVQSVMQVPMSTIPRMLELRKTWNGDYANIGTSLAHGTVDGMFQLANTLTGGKFEGLTRQVLQLGGKDLSETSLAIHKFMNENDISRMSLSDTGASREGGFAKTVGNTLADTFLNAPMNLFEGPTRSWAFSSFARQAVKDGHPIDLALKIAKEQMDTMVNYNPEASAMGLSNLGAVGQEAKGLHTFMINYYSQLYRYIDLAKNQKQAQPLLAYLGLTFAVGGAVGFIGADLADWLMDGVKAAMRGSKLDTPDLQKFSIRKWLLENTPDAVSVGALSTTTGLGLYGSFTTKVVDPERSFLDNTFPKTMASLQIAKGVVNAPRLLDPNLSQKDRGTIVENLAPKYLTQTLRNRYQNQDGVVYDPNADRAGLPMYKRTDKEQQISKYGFGVRSLPEVMAQEDTSQLWKGQRNVSESQKKQLEKLDSLLVAGWKSGDKMTEFQRQAISKQLGNVIQTWKVNPDTINTRIEKLATDYGIPNDALRKMINMKDVNFSNVDRFKDLNTVYNRQLERQQKYGR